MRAFIGCLIVLFRDFDILHSFAVAQPATALPTLACRFFKRKAIVVDWDDDWSGGLGRYHPYPVWKAISFLERRVPRVADIITVASEYLKNKCLFYGFPTEKVFKITNGSDVDSIKPMDREGARSYLKINQDEQIVLAIGHTYMGSMDFLLRAYEKTREACPHAKLYLVGRIGLAIHRIRERFNHLMEYIVFTGEQPYEKIPYYLGAADVLVLPMEDSPMEQSRFPIRLGDYLASGRPIVSNAAGEAKLVLESEGCGLTCDSQDILSFVRNILNLLKDEKLQNELGIKARLAAETRYSWRKIAFSLASVYVGL